MAVTINGTTGLAVPLGTAAAPGVVNTTSATTGIYNPTSTTLGFATNGTQALYINASQNVGIGGSTGTTTVANGLAVNNATAANYPGYEIQTAGVTRMYFNANNAAAYIATVGSIPLISYVNGAEAMRIDTSGNVGIGTNSPSQKLDVNGLGRMRFTSGTGAGHWLDTIGNASRFFVGSDATAEAWRVYDSGGGGANRIYLDSSGNVGIGTSSPGNRLHISGASNAVSGVSIQSTGASGRKYTIYSASTGGLYFSNDTGGGDQMVLDASGNLLVGTTALLATGTHSFVNSATPLTLRNSASTAGRYWFTGPDSSASYLIYNNASTGVYVAYGNTTWSSTSDERLKTDLVPIKNAASKVSTLRAVTGRFKTDEEGKSRSFLIAQDVQAVLPEAVDASDPDKLGVQYTDVIPLLVAAIQELSAEVEALKAKVGA